MPVAKEQAAAFRETIGEGLVIAPAGDPLLALAFVLLKKMMSDFVQEHIEEHEIAERVTGPRHNGLAYVVGVNKSASPPQALLRLQWKSSRQPPGWPRLIVECDSAGNGQRTHHEIVQGRCTAAVTEFDCPQAISAFLAEEAQEADNVRPARRVEMPFPGTLDDKCAGRAPRRGGWSRRPVPERCPIPSAFGRAGDVWSGQRGRVADKAPGLAARHECVEELCA
ncbi:MAG: hypothetical protein ACREUU_11295, partial [Gammaproteobacteria bacterium]